MDDNQFNFFENNGSNVLWCPKIYLESIIMATFLPKKIDYNRLFSMKFFWGLLLIGTDMLIKTFAQINPLTDTAFGII